MKEPKIEDYQYLRNMNIEAWAWEYIRRNPAYIKAWKKHFIRSTNKQNACQKLIIDQQEKEYAAKFGLLFFQRS